MPVLVFIALLLLVVSPSRADEKTKSATATATLSDSPFADRIDCLRLLGDRKTPKLVPGLASALREMRRPNGDRVPMTVEEFDTQVRDLALFLVGQRTSEQMKGNRFFDPKTGKIVMEDPLRGLFEGDLHLVQTEINNGIQRELGKIRYDGKTVAAVKKELDGEEVVVVFTHQLGRLQAETAAKMAASPDLKGKRAVWLVGAESSEPLGAGTVSEAKLVEHSIGGEFNFKLSAAKKVIIAGGAMDQCLLQTIHSIAQKTKGDITIEVLQPLSYIDLIKEPHVTVTRFLKDHADESDEYQRRLRREVEELLGDDGYDVEKSPASGKDTLLGMSLTGRKGRKIKIVFRQ